MPATQLATLGIFETSHLERWVVQHPEVLGGNVRAGHHPIRKVVLRFGRPRQRARLYILGLDSSGELVVVELKRGIDSNVYMQAITYAALVAGFSKATLADAHADYLNRRLESDKVSVAVDTLVQDFRGRISPHRPIPR